MGRGVSSSKITKEFIFSKVSQITVFSAYLNLSDSIIKRCIDTGELICSPIRNDVHPTCGFRYNNKGKLKFRDFSGYFWGDCIDVVAYIISEIYHRPFDVNKKSDFVLILKHITLTFKDIFYGKEKDINLINTINDTIVNIKNKKPIIEVVIRNWNKNDIEYWSQFGIDIKALNVNFIYAVDQYYINRKVNPEPKYYYDVKDPCYAYNLGKDKNNIDNIKLYFPKRRKGETRFITNSNHLEGIYNFAAGNNYDIIVITKSTKDRVSIFNAIINHTSLYGEDNKGRIGLINLPHETYKLRQIEYDWINSKLTNNGIIVSLMDNDAVGKREAIWLRNNYNIVPILIPNKYNAKDFAEFVNKTDFGTVNRNIDKAVNYLNNKRHEKRNITIGNTEESNTVPY